MNKDEAHGIIMKAVIDHIGLYKGGPSYFTALDKWIIDSGHLMDFVNVLIGEVHAMHPKRMNVIVSGKFGRAFANLCDQENMKFNKLVVVNGGLRDPTTICDDLTYLDNMYAEPFYYIDDSYHCGKTLRAIKIALHYVGANMVGALIIYDGSRYLPPDVNVTSLFRYYDWEGR